jgi:hypothetical protein
MTKKVVGVFIAFFVRRFIGALHLFSAKNQDLDLQPQPAAPLPMKDIRCLGNHLKFLNNKKQQLFFENGRTNQYWINHQRAIENEFYNNPEIQKITGIN